MAVGRRRMLSAGAAQAVAEALIPTGEADPPTHETTESPAVPEAGAPSLLDGWGSVVESVVSLDVSATHARLYAELTIGDGAVEYGTVLRALDGADRNIVDAERLARAAKLEQERIDREIASNMEIMRSGARAELEREKVAGERSKAPTIQDVEDRIMANWPKSSGDLKQRSQEIHAVRSVCEQLVVAWRSRASSLRSMADRYAPRRDPST